MFWLILGCARPEAELQSTRYAAVTGDDGYLAIEVDVTSEVDVFQVVVTRDEGLLSTDYLVSPAGNMLLDWEDWYESAYSLSLCFFPGAHATTFNWPVRAEDGPLEKGVYSVQIAALDDAYAYAPGVKVEVEVLTRRDPDPTTGTLRAVIAYAEGVRGEEGVQTAVEGAAAYWVDLYADQGLTLEVEYSDLVVDASLPEVAEGLEAYVTFLEASGERVVLLVVGEEISGDAALYGEAGGIPGPWAPTRRSAVEVGWLANAGADGSFSRSDVLLFGETMAHEAGHYLGLFHPVEADYSYWDSLEDTAECDDWERCDDALGRNLMYPYPVCSTAEADTCVRQSILTDAQAGVMQRYVGVE